MALTMQEPSRPFVDLLLTSDRARSDITSRLDVIWLRLAKFANDSGFQVKPDELAKFIYSSYSDNSPLLMMLRDDDDDDATDPDEESLASGPESALTVEMAGSAEMAADSELVKQAEPASDTDSGWELVRHPWWKFWRWF
jgi:hypothetical protein